MSAWLLLLLACGAPDPSTSPGWDPISERGALQDHGCEAAGNQGAAITFWLDHDGDSYGDPRYDLTACAQPPGTSHRAGDCDDTRASSHPEAQERCNQRDDDCDGQTDEDDAVDAVRWLADRDEDGWPDTSTERVGCRTGPNWIQPGADPDCDDGDPAVHPGASEICNGIDDDCDGLVDGDDAADLLMWYRDADGDGFGDAATARSSCEPASGWIEPGAWADCDDGDPAVHPQATELCNGVDDDCDGVVDEEDAPDAVPWYVDNDGDRFGDPARSVLSCDPPPGYVSSPGDCDDLRAETHLGAEELCNGLDDDCDGVVDEDDATDAGTWFADADGDRFGDPDAPRRACELPPGHSATGGDCDDTRASVHPESTEVCNGIDDDCDVAVDESDADDAFTWYLDADLDGWGDRNNRIDACYQPTGYVSPRGDCDDADPGVHPGASERADGKDNDCDGAIDDLAPGG